MVQTKREVSWIGNDYTTAKTALAVGSLMYAGIIVRGIWMMLN